MIRTGAHPGLDEPCRQRVDLAARQAVDDARLAAAPAQDVEDLPLQVRARNNAVDQVRPVERSDELDGILQLELRRDVAPDAVRGRRGEGVQAHAGKERAKPPELAVLRTEIVSPLADAVRLVYRDEADIAAAPGARENVTCLPCQPFGRHVEEAVASFTQPRQDRGLLVGGQRAVVERGGHAVADERVDLVLHQRNERRHDEAEPRSHERGRLEAQRLAAARGQDDDRIARVEDGAHGVALKGPERRVAPVSARARAARDLTKEIRIRERTSPA